MSDPTRQPCAGSKNTTSDCGGVSGKLTAYKNVSTMADEVPDEVAPFARLIAPDPCTSPGSLSCIPLGGGSGTDHCVSVLTDALVRDSLPPNTVDGGGYDPATDPILVQLGNTFEADGKTSYGCEGFGAKIVDGVKSWHGAFPFTHTSEGINCESPWKFWNGAAYDEITGGITVVIWSNTVSYVPDDLVLFDALVYIAINSSTGSLPSAIASPDWTIYSTYDFGTTYIIDDIVFDSGIAYRSLQNANTSHAPASSPTRWQAGGVPNRTNVKYRTRQFTVTNYKIRDYYDVITQVTAGGGDLGEPPGQYDYAKVEFFADVTRSVARLSGEISTTGDAASQTNIDATVSIGSYLGGYPKYITYTAGSSTDIACADITADGPGISYGYTIKDDIKASPRCVADLPLFDAENIGGWTANGWNVNLASAAIASGVLHFLANPNDGDQITVGSQTYTFKNTPVAGNDIQIGTNAADTDATYYQPKLASHPQVTVNAFGGGAYLVRREGNTDTIGLSTTASTRIVYGASALPPPKEVSGWTWSDTIIRPYFGDTTGTFLVDVTITRTATTYEWDVFLQYSNDINAGSGVCEGYVFYRQELDYSGIIELTEPYNIGDSDPLAAVDNVLRDTATLTAEWQLRDKADAAEATTWRAPRYLDHPWRSDEHCYEGVEVRRDEKQATSPEITFDACPVPDWSVWPIGEQDWFDTDVLEWDGPEPTNADETRTLISTGIYTGNIIGKPLPRGYGVSVGGTERGSFDHFYVRWQQKFCTGDSTCRESGVSEGMWTPSYLPANAQRWTQHDAWPQYTFANLYGSPNRLYPCSFIKADLYGIHLRKMVETIIPKPAYDFTRPHTADRFLLDQPTDPESLTKIYYVNSVVGSVVTLDNRDGTAATDVTGDFTAGDIVGVVTISGTPGFYEVSSVSGGTVTVGALKWLVPTGFANDSGDASRAFGKVRFPDAPGFSGLLKVTATDDSGDTLLTYAASPCIQTDDLVDLWNGTTWDDNGGAGYALTRLTDTTATISGSYLDTTHIVPHTYAVIDPDTSLPLSGHKWWFCGVAQTWPNKGDHVVRSWTLNIDINEQEPDTITATQRCLPIGIPCSSRVVGFSPQYYDSGLAEYVAPTNELSEYFVNGMVEAHPLLVNNGDQWLGAIEQHMVDPLWQIPHKPDEDGYAYGDITWTMDDGSCQEDIADEFAIQKFYPMPAVFEARTTVPGGYGPANDKTAPDLIAGATPLDTEQNPPSNGLITAECDPGFFFDQAMPTTATPWGDFYRQQTCVCDTGRFYANYHANQVNC